ncbi:MAG: UDP-N-acetylmuramoyl-L-alanine--D-glutamate ligase, partial [Chloroflexota bacterium]|nr:UDP-N-acetylmuramoyl-L-alanine--D-glutamate ligase [Chloroflexota bacterium]
SCVTNLAPDHLNRYRDMEDYASAKQEIYRYQRPEDVAVLNHDDPIVRAFAEDCPAEVRWFGQQIEAQRGAWLRAGQLVLRGEGERRVLRADEVALPGAHNVSNALAVAALADANRLPAEQIAEGLRTFTGLPDRMELVRAVDGVRWVNDTTSTVPASTVAALRSVDGPVVLIAGGASKRVGFAELAEEICARVSALVLLEGTATEELQTEIYKRCPCLETSVHGDLESAVQLAAERSRPGYTVLLSPACASFGMFDNEFQRGELFRQAVNRLDSHG